MRSAYIIAGFRKPAKDVGSKWIFVFAFVFLAALHEQRCPFMESRFPDGPVGAGSTQGSLPGEPLVAMPLSLSHSLSLSLPMSIGSLANLVLAERLSARFCLKVRRLA